MLKISETATALKRLAGSASPSVINSVAEQLLQSLGSINLVRIKHTCVFMRLSLHIILKTSEP
jgi:hypothetical protein